MSSWMFNILNRLISPPGLGNSLRKSEHGSSKHRFGVNVVCGYCSVHSTDGKRSDSQNQGPCQHFLRGFDPALTQSFKRRYSRMRIAAGKGIPSSACAWRSGCWRTGKIQIFPQFSLHYRSPPACGCLYGDHLKVWEVLS